MQADFRQRLEVGKVLLQLGKGLINSAFYTAGSQDTGDLNEFCSNLQINQTFLRSSALPHLETFHLSIPVVRGLPPQVENGWCGA